MGKYIKVLFVWVPVAIILCISAAMCIGIASLDYEDIYRQIKIIQNMERR